MTEPEERYTIGVRVSTQRWFVQDRQTDEAVGPTYATREQAIAAMERMEHANLAGNYCATCEPTGGSGMSPVRVQRQRRKGSRMPEGAVYVGRPSRWGNPFDWMEFGRDVAVVLYRNALIGHWNPSVLEDRSDTVFGFAYTLHHEFRRRMGPEITDQARYELRGRDLACWCALDDQCHADVLLVVANAESVPESVTPKRTSVDQ